MSQNMTPTNRKKAFSLSMQPRSLSYNHTCASFLWTARTTCVEDGGPRGPLQTGAHLIHQLSERIWKTHSLGQAKIYIREFFEIRASLIPDCVIKILKIHIQKSVRIPQNLYRLQFQNSFILLYVRIFTCCLKQVIYNFIKFTRE